MSYFLKIYPLIRFQSLSLSTGPHTIRGARKYLLVEPGVMYLLYVSIQCPGKSSFSCEETKINVIGSYSIPTRYQSPACGPCLPWLAQAGLIRDCTAFRHPERVALFSSCIFSSIQVSLLLAHQASEQPWFNHRPYSMSLSQSS